MEKPDRATIRKQIDEAVVAHYHRNLEQTGDRNAAAKLVVLDMLQGANVPPARYVAHARIVSDILTKYENDSFAAMVAEVEGEYDGR